MTVWGHTDYRERADGTLRLRVRAARELPVAPLIPHIQAFLKHHRIFILGERCGVSRRQIQRYLSGEATSIRLDNADCLCIAMDITLTEVYGE